MVVFWELLILATCCLLCQGLEGNSTDHTDEKKTFKVELFPPNPAYAGQTRMPRKFFTKIHSGASFLTGLKLGALLSKKGFELGHGKVSSIHSFQMFGKNVNSAMSLSYGDKDSLLPIFDDAPGNGGELKKSDLNKDEKKVFHVTVIEDPVNETAVNESADEVQDNETERKRQDILILYQDTKEEKKNQDFVAEHNKRVKEFNESINRRSNSKF